MRDASFATVAFDAAASGPVARGRHHVPISAAAAGSKALEPLLARIAAAKDQAAFAALYSATRGKLFSTVLLIVRRWDLAEDIIQDVYSRIWLNAHSYRSAAGSPMTWMITIARNLAIDTARKSAREVHADEATLLALPCDLPTAMETIEAAEDQRTAIEQQQRVLAALHTLDPAKRELVIAAYLHGESREQLSKRAGVPVNTVKTWIRRAVLEVQIILRNSEINNAVGEARNPRDSVARVVPSRSPYLTQRPASPEAAALSKVPGSTGRPSNKIDNWLAMP